MQQSGRQLRRHFSRRAQFSYATHCHKHHALKKGQNPFTKEENCWLLQDALVATSSDCKPYQTAGFHCQKLRGPRKKKESSVNLILFSSWRHLPTPEHWADPRPDPAQQFSCSYISIIGIFPQMSKLWSHLLTQWWLKARGCSKHPSIPGADSHLLWIMDVGAVLPAITPAEAVVVHAVLLLLLFLLLGLTNDGQTPLNGTAKRSERDRLW